MYLFYLRHGTWPLDKISPTLGFYRARPKILGGCEHPLFIREFGSHDTIPFDDNPEFFQAYESNIRRSIGEVIQTCFKGFARSIGRDAESISIPDKPGDFITQAIHLYAKRVSPETACVFSSDGVNSFSQACLYYENIISKIEPYNPIAFLIEEIKHSPTHLSKVFANSYKESY
ncbi:MAG: hypothetical protein EOP48_18315 [Sphingobacteriales bacterium]|nr:MAG: hypothetical protein EOP48_18315 [Sphingobacteriales bacterium]